MISMTACLADFLYKVPAEVLPEGVMGAFASIQASEASLLPEELMAMVQMSSNRRQEFATARSLLRSLFDKYAVYEFPILNDLNSGRPIWPDGYTGGISHSKGWVWVVCAQNPPYCSLGIDLEKRYRLKQSLWQKLFTQTEINFLNQQSNSEQSDWATLFFTIKEAYYKYQYGLTSKRLGFLDVVVSVNIMSKSMDIAEVHNMGMESQVKAFIQQEYIGALVF